jgi:hypothetical protein
VGSSSDGEGPLEESRVARSEPQLDSVAAHAYGDGDLQVDPGVGQFPRHLGTRPRPVLQLDDHHLDGGSGAADVGDGRPQPGFVVGTERDR